MSIYGKIECKIRLKPNQMEIITQISIAIGSAIFVLGITRPETYLKIKETLFYTIVVISILLSTWNGLLLFFKSVILKKLVNK